MKVHNTLGNGFQEVICQRCLAIEYQSKINISKNAFDSIISIFRTLVITNRCERGISNRQVYVIVRSLLNVVCE
jgi:hypothetical protein